MKQTEEHLKIYNLFIKALNEHSTHLKPAPETIKRLDAQDARMDDFFKLIRNHVEAEDKYRKEELQPLIDAWKEYTTFGVVSKRVFSGSIKLLIGITVIIGSIVGLKEWINRP